MARPSSAVGATSKHLTKEEREQREAAEKALVTGRKFQERADVAANEISHAEFIRLSELLGSIGKDDALYEVIINRYCQLAAECAEFVSLRETFSANLKALMQDDEMESTEKYSLQSKMQTSLINADRQLQSKRKMMFDIERECAMTFTAAMRSIPKNPAPKASTLLEALNGKN